MQKTIDRSIVLANIVVALGAALYLYSMLIHPWLNGGWKNVHAVWLEWQSLNVGILAFLASLIAFNVSRHHANQQRKREMVAARSFLPDALSDLDSYFEASAETLKLMNDLSHVGRAPSGAPIDVRPPQLPGTHREIFSRCISLAEPPLAEYLSYILKCLQVHNARISQVATEFRPGGNAGFSRDVANSYMLRLGELQALINNLFDYARGEAEFSQKTLNWETMKNAFSNLHVYLEYFPGLEDFTKRKVGNSWNIS